MSTQVHVYQSLLPVPDHVVEEHPDNNPVLNVLRNEAAYQWRKEAEELGYEVTGVPQVTLTETFPMTITDDDGVEVELPRYALHVEGRVLVHRKPWADWTKRFTRSEQNIIINEGTD